ncbi:MAG TPA: sigma-70 family RNA polymerase sigma factor [Gemmatimonadaceae bacterium]|nr:sigma-70 family RNA polymerase sigma factor [Gemmatimonadaceae bacterium]
MTRPVTLRAVQGYHSPEMTDAACVQAALAGDGAAFAMLVDRHSPACLRFARRMLGSREDAEDAAQEAFVRAHRALARYDGRTSFRTWLMSILVNRCRTAMLQRHRRTKRVVLDEAALDQAAAVDGSDHDLRDAIERALSRLEAGQREAFLLKHVEQLTYEEMAEATGAGVSALKMRVQRACDRLQILLKEDRYA